MSAQGQPVSPGTTLAIILGASEWPFADLPQSAMFARSARSFRSYIQNGFRLPSENLLDLFDSEKEPSQIDKAISDFLQKRQSQLNRLATPAQDLILYYVGHGSFTSGEQKYFLAIRSTRRNRESVSSLRMPDLATTLKQDALKLRRYLILDCCFAASAYTDFQATSPADAVRVKTLEDLPSSGTALLCASSARDVALAPVGQEDTMFTGALLDILKNGRPLRVQSFSLEELGRLTELAILDRYKDKAVRPQVVSPDRRQGDVAVIPLFPNPAFERTLDEPGMIDAAVARKPGGWGQDPPRSGRKRLRRGVLASVIASVVLAFAVRMRQTTPVIETFAGTDQPFRAEGRQALDVPFGHSYGIAYANGNVYMSDLGNQAIAMIDSGNRVHILAGPESSPANRPATPSGLAVDASGGVYFGEGTCHVRKLLPSGEVKLVAGADRCGYTPDGVPAVGAAIQNIHGVVSAKDGAVIFSDWANNRVRRVDSNGLLRTVAGDGRSSYGGDGGPAVSASLYNPSGLSLDDVGDLFIADMHNSRIREVSPSGVMTTAAVIDPKIGSQRFQESCPTGVAVTKKGVLFVADPCKRYIFKVINGRVSIYGGIGAAEKEPFGAGGAALSAAFDEWSLALEEPSENLLISGPDFGHIYRIDTSGRFDIIAGNGLWRIPSDGTVARQASFQNLFRVALDPTGDLILTDYQAYRIYKISGGIVKQLAGNGHFGSDPGEPVATETVLDGPYGVQALPDGSVVFADSNNHRICQVTTHGRLKTLAGNGSAGDSGDGGPATTASLRSPVGIAIDPAGPTIYFTDKAANRVRRITPAGQIMLVAGNGNRGFGGDQPQPAELAYLNAPEGVVINPSSNEVFIADTGNNRVRRVSGGMITTFAGTGLPTFSGDGQLASKASLNAPCDLALGLDTLYILDCGDKHVRGVNLSSGIIRTVAGNGDSIDSGDGGSPLNAGLGDAKGIAIDREGNLYLTGGESGKVRVIRHLSGSR